MSEIAVALDKDLIRRLQEAADRAGRSLEEEIARALREHVGRPERPWPKGVGEYDSGRFDISEGAEEILRERVRDRG